MEVINEISNEWTGARLQTLRLKLGWSRAELARRLEFCLEELSLLETSKKEILLETKLKLEGFESLHEDYTRRLHHLPVAEQTLKQMKLSQIQFIVK